MNRGYVKLWRVSLEKPIFQNAGLWQFATWCLMKATHKKRSQMVGYQVVDIEPGQFVYGRDSAASQLRSTPRKMRTCINRLTKIGFLTIKTTNKFSIITIVNWGLYQPEENITTNKLTNKRPTNDQQTTTNKNVKNVKNKEHIAEIVSYLNQKTGKHFKPTTEPTQKSINARMSNGYTVEDFKRVIDNKVSDWLNNPKMEKFLAPETLFRPSKFEKYLNEKPKQPSNTPDWL